MSDDEDMYKSEDSFGKSLLSTSIYFEDPNAAEELSKLMLSDVPEEEKEKSICDLKHKNEFKNAYKKKENLPDKTVQDNFDDKKVKTTDLQYKSNLAESLYSKIKNKEIKEEDNAYLKIEDFSDNPILDLFVYDDVIDKIKNLIPICESELNKVDINQIKRENIYRGKGVEVMVEETYCFDKYIKNQMTEEICYLKRIMNCWRRVAGDGNCFYRSVIFSWLEYLVFNKKTTILKIVIANLYTKFDPNYQKNKELPTYLKKQFITDERFIALTILEIIIRQLNKNQIKEAYLTLLKAFNNSRVFDRIMIFYLRYLLFDFISENQSKLFKKDFPVLLGNLLPQEYEKEDGTFLYKEYFINDLLKFYTCAEKLAVYLVPFILKVNLNIVFYYFGKDCDIENKFFSCELPNKDKKKDTINVLFRKAHYDIAYTKDYYNDFQPLLDLYCNLNMVYKVDYYIVDLKDINQKEISLNKDDPFNPELSVVFNRVLYNKKMKIKEEEKKVEKIKPIEQIIEQNIETKNNENKIPKLANDEDILKRITKKHSLDICFICGNDIKDNEGNKEVLPCKCNIAFCSGQCKENYYKFLEIFFNKMEIGFNIKCGNCGNNINRVSFLDNKFYGKEKMKNALKNKMNYFFKTYCMYCLDSITPEKKYKLIRCKCPQLHKLLDNSKFEHRICEKCFDINTGSCKICNLYHSRLVN